MDLVSLAIGAISAAAPIIAWSASRIIRIRKEAQAAQSELESRKVREAYEMDKARSTDAYQELLKALEQIKITAAQEHAALYQRVEASERKIHELQEENLMCLKRSALQEVEISKQANVITFLEARIKSLESSKVSNGST